MVLKSPATIVPVAPMSTLVNDLLPCVISLCICSTLASILSKRVSRCIFVRTYQHVLGISRSKLGFSFSNIVFSIFSLAQRVLVNSRLA